MQNLQSLEFLAETFQCRGHNFQCFAVPVELAAMKFVFRFMVVGIAGILVWLACGIVSKIEFCSVFDHLV